MTTTDISPEAVERLACILEGRGGFVKDSTITVTLRALSAALTQSRASEAAAYEAVAEMISEYPHFMLMTPDQKKVCVHLAQVIRSLATPDQRAALDRMIAEAEARGMERAAEIARALGMTELETSVTPIGPRTQAFYAAHDAILAAIPQGDATND